MPTENLNDVGTFTITPESGISFSIDPPPTWEIGDGSTLVEGVIPYVEASIEFSRDGFRIEEGFLPPLETTIRFTGTVQSFFQIDGELPDLEGEFANGWQISEDLPGLESDLAFARRVYEIDGLLPGLEGDIQYARRVFEFEVELPGLEGEFQIGGWFLEGELPPLQIETELTLIPTWALEGSIAAPTFITQFTLEETWEIEAELPGLTTAGAFLWELEAELPGLVSDFAFVADALSIAGITAVARVMNTRTGKLTEYDNYNFQRVGTVRGNNYGLKDGKLYRLSGSDDAGTLISAFFSTRPDDRIFSEATFELAPSQELKRLYGVYAQGRITKGLKYEITYGENETDIFSLPDDYFVLNGVDNFELPTYRGPVATHFAITIRNVQGDQNYINGLYFVAEPVEEKVWRP